jgi:hypothetical protein
MQYQDFVDTMMTLFDAMVDSGSDEELFASGYLSGHFSLAVAAVERDNKLSVSALLQCFNCQLESAFNENELSEDDQAFVENCWNNWQIQVLARDRQQ